MLLNEFTDRTGYEPSQQEWENINQVYSDSNLDKDAFCSIWVSQHKEEIAYYKKAQWVHRVSYRLASLSGNPEVFTKSQLISFIKDLFNPKHVRNLSVLCDVLSKDHTEVYFHMVNNEIYGGFDYINQAKSWYDNGQQSPMFKIYLSGNRFQLELIKNIRMFDYWTVDVRYPIQH